MQKDGYCQHCEIREWARGVDLKLFSPERRSEEFRAARDISPADVTILWVGRLVPEKRVDIWINVVQRLQAEGVQVKAIVAGHGSYESTLATMSNVTCCGWLSGVALAEAYASADILLFPSDVETFGNVTLEALASGCVCVVEDLCGGHLVEHGSNGYACPSGDTEMFYQATKRIVQDDRLRKAMSQNARESVFKFERNKIQAMMTDNYKDAIMSFRDPNYNQKRIQEHPEIQGYTWMSYVCCNFWLVRTFAEPFLNTTASFQNTMSQSQECLTSSKHRLSCSDLRTENAILSLRISYG